MHASAGHERASGRGVGQVEREERGERREKRGATPVRARLKKRGGERGESGSDTLISGLDSREEGKLTGAPHVLLPLTTQHVTLPTCSSATCHISPHSTDIGLTHCHRCRLQV